MRHYVDSGIPTLQAALFDYMNSDDLKNRRAAGLHVAFYDASTIQPSS